MEDDARARQWWWIVSCREVFLADPVHRRVLRAPDKCRFGIIPLLVYFARCHRVFSNHSIVTLFARHHRV